MDNFAYPFKKSLYLNITNRCSNNCLFCEKNTLENYVGCSLKLKKEPSFDQLISAVRQELKKFQPKEIVFCGFGEPLLFLPLVLPTIRALKKYDILIRINTNGQVNLFFPNKNVAVSLAKAGLDKISISLNAHNNKSYQKVCQPKLGEKAFPSVLEFIKNCQRAGIKTRITFVEKFCDVKKCKKLARGLGVDYFFRATIHLPKVSRGRHL